MVENESDFDDLLETLDLAEAKVNLDSLDPEEFDDKYWLMTEEDAKKLIEDFFSDSIDSLLDGETTVYPRSTQSFYNELNRTIEANKKRIKQGGTAKTRRDRPGRREVRQMVGVLKEFLREFCKEYIKLRPTPSKPEKFKFSKGQYENSSIIYFTNDESIRHKRLMQSRTSEWFTEDEPILGFKYIMKELEPSRIWRPEGDPQTRIEKIKGGITIENVALSKNKKVYYGWKNVEMEGWSHKAPYRPFRGALEYAQSQFPNLVNVTINN